jgi:hypothetical protein
MANVTLRNAITNDRHQINPQPGKTVKQAVEESGFVQGTFSVRDKNGQIIDNEMIDNFSDAVLNVGLPGESVVGG